MVLTIFKEGGKVLGIALYKTMLEIFKRDLVTKEEAYKILAVQPQDNENSIYIKYQDLYKRNSRENNGSKYLQSRIKNAYDFLKL